MDPLDAFSSPVGKPQVDSGLDSFSSPVVTAKGPFAERFGAMQAPAAGKEDLATKLARIVEGLRGGPEVSPSGQMLGQHENLLSAASQGTSPNIGEHNGKLVSAETFQNDAGELQYRDPQTGNLVPTNSKTQVALRDPADNTIKVFERSDATNENPAVGVARVLAPGLMAGAPTARAGIAAAPKPTASDVFSTAKPYYRAFEQEAGKIDVPPETAAGIGERIRAKLGKANLIPELAQPVYAAVDILDKGEPLTLDALQNVKRVAGRGFNSPDKNVRDAAAVVSGEIGKVINEVSPEAGQSLKTADEIHSTAKSLQEVQRLESQAGLRVGRAGYGGNKVNPMRQLLAPIVNKAIEGRVTGFQPDEIGAMRDIVEGTPATNSARLAGQLSPAKGIISTGGEILAAAHMGPAALVFPALGIAGNKVATALTDRQILALKDLIAKRSPAYSEAVAKATDRWERSQVEFASEPSPNKFLSYLNASRTLANGLTRDGIEVSSGALLRAIRGPESGAADNEQEPVPGVPRE